MEIIRATGLAKTYGRSGYALHPTNLAIRNGVFVGIVGPSGAGKTTFLRCLNRLVEPSAGDVLLDGTSTRAIALRELRRRVSIIFQHPNLIVSRSVLQNVLLGRLGFLDGARAVIPWFSRQDKILALEALDRVGMIDCAMARCSELSGGQQQRVAIARAIVQGARVLLADEPIASLDPENARRVMELLREINRRDRVTVLVNLHQIDLARRFADVLLAFRSGRLAFNGTAADFSDQHYHAVFASA